MYWKFCTGFEVPEDSSYTFLDRWIRMMVVYNVSNAIYLLYRCCVSPRIYTDTNKDLIIEPLTLK